MSKKTKKIVTTITEEIIEGSNKTLIACVLDRSGSMDSIISDAIGGFNTFLTKQQSLDEEDATMTVVLFDDRYEMLHNNVNINKVEKMTREVWSPRGMTALYDAIGKTINNIEDELKNLKSSERPDKILVAIVTDGQENASKEFTGEMIKNLIKKKEKEDWQFVYLAANQDAFSVGTSFGLNGGNTFTYTNTAQGNTVMFDSLSMATSKYRSLTKQDVNYSVASSSLFVDTQNVNPSIGNVVLSGNSITNSNTFTKGNLV